MQIIYSDLIKFIRPREGASMKYLANVSLGYPKI